MRHFLSVADATSHDLRWMLDRADAYRTGTIESSRIGAPRGALILERPSLRTRLAYEGAFHRLGGQLSIFEGGIGTDDTTEDLGRVLSAMVDIALVRTHDHLWLESLASASSIPVVNALSDREHPVEVLADALVIRDVFGTFVDKTIAFVGGSGNVCASLLLLAPLLGMHAAVATPPRSAPDPNLLTQAYALAASAGTRLVATDDVETAVLGADVVYTDAWPNLGDAAEEERRFGPYRVTAEMMAMAAENAIFLHCLPATRGREVAAEVLDSEASFAFSRLKNLAPASAAAIEWALTTQPAVSS